MTPEQKTALSANPPKEEFFTSNALSARKIIDGVYMKIERNYESGVQTKHFTLPKGDFYFDYIPGTEGSNPAVDNHRIAVSKEEKLTLATNVPLMRDVYFYYNSIPNDDPTKSEKQDNVAAIVKRDPSGKILNKIEFTLNDNGKVTEVNGKEVSSTAPEIAHFNKAVESAEKQCCDEKKCMEERLKDTKTERKIKEKSSTDTALNTNNLTNIAAISPTNILSDSTSKILS